MTLSLSEFHKSLRELDSLVSICFKFPERTEYHEFIRIFAKNIGTHALHMMGRRQCPVTGYFYFLDSAEKEFSLILKLEDEIGNETDNNGGTSGEKQQMPYLLR